MRRFIIYWILDYVVATMVVFVISSAGPAIFGSVVFSYVSLLYIPIGTVFFSWLAYRGVERQSAHRLVVATVWVGLAALIDVSVAVLVSQASFFAYLLSPIVLGVYGLKFLGVFVGAYLGLSPMAKSAAIERPSLRSGQALQRSSDLLRRAQE